MNLFNASLLTRLEFALLPGRCLLCEAATSKVLDLCTSCQEQLPLLEHCCPCCALPLPHSTILCAECQQQAPPYQQIIALMPYEHRTRDLIYRLKNNGDLATARVLACLLANNIDQHYADAEMPSLIVPTPSYWQRTMARGYNPAQLIALILAKRLGIASKPAALKRVHQKQQQKRKPRQNPNQKPKGNVKSKAKPAANKNKPNSNQPKVENNKVNKPRRNNRNKNNNKPKNGVNSQEK